MELILDNEFLVERGKDIRGVPVVQAVFCCEACLTDYEEMYPHHFDMQPHVCTEQGCVLFLGTLH